MPREGRSLVRTTLPLGQSLARAGHAKNGESLYWAFESCSSDGSLYRNDHRRHRRARGGSPR